MSSHYDSTKELFLKALCKRDINTLEHILDDEISYFGASKKTFLERIEYIFNDFKLGRHKGDLKLKKHKKHKNTYYLSSYTRSYSFKFIIEDDNGKILKIYNNKKVNSVDDAEWINEFDLYFGEDERLGFEPSDRYLETLQECTKAYEELENGTTNVITSVDINNWLKKHKALYDRIYPQYQYFKYNDFRNLFRILNWYYEILQNYDKAKVALMGFNICEIDEIDDWCEHFTYLYTCKTMGLSDPLLVDSKNQRIKYQYNSNIFFIGDDFFTIWRFNEIWTRCFQTRGEGTSWH